MCDFFGKLTLYWVFIWACLLPNIVIATVPGSDSCKLAIIAGAAADPARGIGVNIATDIFRELDVPMSITTYQDQTEMLHALNSGRIDLIVSTYKVEELTKFATILSPAYMMDPITVAVRDSELVDIHNWESLVGLRGARVATLSIEPTVLNYLDSYLSIDQDKDLLAMLRQLQDKQLDYVVASKLQLKYLIKNYGLKSLAIADNLHKGGNIYMAFSKSSNCSQYVAYLRKRLQDYKNNGKVEKIIQQYVH